MAIARCETHEPKGRTQDYVVAKLPAGFPNSGVICGSVKCPSPAKVWLTANELKDYNSGERIFRPDSNVAKFLVQ